jgi:hypothetical protein
VRRGRVIEVMTERAREPMGELGREVDRKVQYVKRIGRNK